MSPEVEVELQGLAAEQRMPAGDLEAIKILDVDHLATWEELVAWTADDPMQYHRQTMDTFVQALASVELRPGDRVLEIGGEKTFPVLRRCADRGAECFAANIFFEVEVEEMERQWPNCVLSDMHTLPFADRYFDLIVISAAAHHSTDPIRLFAELSRVVKPTGAVLLLNELVAGYLKELGSRRSNTRHELIHEERVPYLTYRRGIREAGFQYRGFFPDHFARRLSAAGQLHPDTRFYRIAQAASWLYRRYPQVSARMASATMPLGQAILGFPLNAVLTKPGGGKPHAVSGP